MQILHIDLRSLNTDYADLRYSDDNLNDFDSRRLPLAEIQDLIDRMERDYYVALPEGYVKTGRRLYDWLDGSDRWLSTRLGSRAVVLAIATGERLAHLPWEVMHDGRGFLVARSQPVVPVRWQGERLTWQAAAVPNRPLQLLFMATSPAGVKPVLDFEAEEGRILTATARQPLTLAVEESGCLSELAELLTSYGPSYFDVVHVSGHAWISDEGPHFITETETGDRYDASPQDIARAFQFCFPALMFLSGCHTGQAGRKGEVPSMAAALLEAGAGAVLGWGRPVRDMDGILAAEALYKALAGARSLPEALALTYRAMIDAKARDWHLLRLYVTGAMPRNLVTPLKMKGRQRAAKPSMATAFLDAEQKVKVPRRESFVGRRRPLQACLRALRDPESAGVLIHGMGGLGKSSLAARLCDRLSDFERLVWCGPLDEAGLVNKLAGQVRDPNLRQQVQDANQPLKYRLRDLFEMAKRDFLLVLDDFEANLEPVGQGFRLKASDREKPAQTMGALMWAIEAAGREHRVVITCRYDFEFGGLRRVYKQPLFGLEGADLRKKQQQLASFEAKLAERPGEPLSEEALQRERALRLADGNPRLLEWLDKVLRNAEPGSAFYVAAGSVDVGAILDAVEANPSELREQVLAQVLLGQMDESMREMLSRARVYELPVPEAAILAVCEAQGKGEISRAVALGLLEQSPDGGLRVPRVLPLDFDSAQSSELAARAAAVLYRLWWEEAQGSSSEVQTLEIHRLAMKGNKGEIAGTIAGRLGGIWKNQSRFREALQLCRVTLEISQDFLVFHQLARSEESLGETEKALADYQNALRLCPETEEKDKAAIIHNLAILKANQGDVEGAIALYQQSLEITEQIGNVQGKAATLHQLAILKANQGDVEGAIALYQQSLEIKEQIGDVQGKAATLHCLASLKADQGDVEGAIALFQQSLEINEQIGDVQTKAMTLWWLGGLAATKQNDPATAITYLQESLAILQRVGSPQAQAVQDLLSQIMSE